MGKTRKAYRAPALRRHGSVEHVTLAMSGMYDDLVTMRMDPPPWGMGGMMMS